jgi:hypothetical protein
MRETAAELKNAVWNPIRPICLTGAKTEQAFP